MTRQPLVLYPKAYNADGSTPKPIPTKGYEISMAPETQSLWTDNRDTKPTATLCFLTGTGSIAFQDGRKDVLIKSPAILKLAAGPAYSIKAGPKGLWFSSTPIR